jgi:SAM-dependent methyltransferase
LLRDRARRSLRVEPIAGYFCKTIPEKGTAAPQIRTTMTEQARWNDRYRDGDLPWDTGRPSSELQRVLSRHAIPPCRALEIGCGTGSNSVWLALQGFEVTGIDLAPLAVEQAEKRAAGAGVCVHFAVGDVLHLPDLGGPFAFFFDRGCYHAVRRNAPQQYAPAVARRLVSGGRGLILAGNAREPHDPGPPVVTEEEIRDELGREFQILDLHEFRFDEAPGAAPRFLGWSCLVEKPVTRPDHR